MSAREYMRGSREDSVTTYNHMTTVCCKFNPKSRINRNLLKDRILLNIQCGQALT